MRAGRCHHSTARPPVRQWRTNIGPAQRRQPARAGLAAETSSNNTKRGLVTTENLTKLTVNVTTKSMAALEASAERLGLSRTDTINRALQMQETLLTADRGDHLVFVNPNSPDLAVQVLS